MDKVTLRVALDPLYVLSAPKGFRAGRQFEAAQQEYDPLWRGRAWVRDCPCLHEQHEPPILPKSLRHSGKPGAIKSMNVINELPFISLCLTFAGSQVVQRLRNEPFLDIQASSKKMF